MKYRRTKRWLAIILLVVMWFISCCVLIPLRHKKVPYTDLKLDSLLPAQLGTANERIQCIDDNVQALLWRLRIIESAQEELILTTFDFRDDESGKDMMCALLSAADRGVKVRIIVDGINGLLYLNKSQWFRTLCESPNVEAKFYNPVNLLTPWRLNYRMHDKYLIADHHAYLLGGRNTGNLFLGNYQDVQNVDRDLLIYAPSADSRNSLSAVRNYFEEIWTLPTTRPFTRSPEHPDQTHKEMQERYQYLHSQYPEAFTVIHWEEETFPTNGVRFLSNSSRVENKSPILWSSLIKLMEHGKNVLVQTPYVICSQDMYQDLTRLEEEGTQIHIVLNATETGANPWGCTDYLNQKDKLRATGMDLYEFIGEHSLHSKTVLVDDRISVVGSFNFDMRSAYLDTELMLVVDSPELNQHLRQVVQQEMDQSLHLSPDGESTPGSQYQPIELTPQKSRFYGVLRIIMPFIRHLM